MHSDKKYLKASLIGSGSDSGSGGGLMMDTVSTYSASNYQLTGATIPANLPSGGSSATGIPTSGTSMTLSATSASLYPPPFEVRSASSSDLLRNSVIGGTSGSGNSSGPASTGAPGSGWANTVPLSTGGTAAGGTGTISSLNRRIAASRAAKLRGGPNPDTFVKEYIKKRNLILSLLAAEVEFFSTWLNPLSLPDLQLAGEEVVNSWRAQAITERVWRDNVRLAWDISPVLAVRMAARLRSSAGVEKEIQRLVQLTPGAVAHIPEALDYLVTPDSILNESPELTYTLYWARVNPIKALSYFSRQYPPHPITAQFAVRCLASYPPDVVLFYIPQLVQAVRYDNMGKTVG